MSLIIKGRSGEVLLMGFLVMCSFIVELVLVGYRSYLLNFSYKYGIFEETISNMQQTFQINPANINAQVIESILATAKAKFGSRTFRLIIDDEPIAAPVDQKELYKKTLELRELFKDVRVPADLNLSDLANEMLGE
jgi:hypothetical protein